MLGIDKLPEKSKSGIIELAKLISNKYVNE
jgi:hypothetical protein